MCATELKSFCNSSGPKFVSDIYYICTLLCAFVFAVMESVLLGVVQIVCAETPFFGPVECCNLAILNQSFDGVLVSSCNYNENLEFVRMKRERAERRRAAIQRYASDNSPTYMFQLTMTRSKNSSSSCWIGKNLCK